MMNNTAPTGAVGRTINGAQEAILEILLKKGGRSGFVDKTGKLVVEPQFEDARQQPDRY
jgi:hypothetical protein